MSIIKELMLPVTEVLETDNYGIYVDFPPMYNDYNRQMILTDINCAISMIFRSFYGSYTSLPQIEGLFIDIVRYKHILDTDLAKMNLNQIVNEALSEVLEGLIPNITTGYDPITGKMQYHITLQGKVSFEVNDAENPLIANIRLNEKKFYE